MSLDFFQYHLLCKLLKRMDKMATALDTLTTEVSEAKGVMESAITLIQGLKGKIDELIAAGNNDPALAALSSELDTSANSLAAAVAANPVP